MEHIKEFDSFIGEKGDDLFDEFSSEFLSYLKDGDYLKKAKSYRDKIKVIVAAMHDFAYENNINMDEFSKKEITGFADYVLGSMDESNNVNEISRKRKGGPSFGAAITPEMKKKYPNGVKILDVVGTQDFYDLFKGPIDDFITGDLDDSAALDDMLSDLEYMFKRAR